jgi:hypothetical protein
MANRVGTQTAGSVIAHLTARLKSYTKKDITQDVWYELINAKTYLIHELMASKDRAIYKDLATLTSSSYKGFFAAYSASTTIDATRKIVHFHNVTMSAISTVANDMINGNAIIVNESTGLMMENEIESVVFGSGIADVTFKTALPAAFTTITEIGLYATARSSSESILISGESYYKMLDQILSIYDSGIADECISVDTLSDFRGMVKRQLTYTLKNSIIWTRDGEYIYFAKGSSITSYGTRTMYYTRKPYSVTADADLIDLPDHQLDLLYSLCMLAGLQTIKVPIPSELKTAESQIGAMKAAKEQEMTQLLKNQGDN